MVIVVNYVFQDDFVKRASYFYKRTISTYL